MSELPWSPRCVPATMMHSTYEEGGRVVTFFLKTKAYYFVLFFP